MSNSFIEGALKVLVKFDRWPSYAKFLLFSNLCLIAMAGWIASTGFEITGLKAGLGNALYMLLGILTMTKAITMLTKGHQVAFALLFALGLIAAWLIPVQLFL